MKRKKVSNLSAILIIILIIFNVILLVFNLLRFFPQQQLPPTASVLNMTCTKEDEGFWNQPTTTVLQQVNYTTEAIENKALDIGHTFDTSSVKTTCTNQVLYQTGDCDYIYGCVLLLPEGSTNIYDALYKDCRQVPENASEFYIRNVYLSPKTEELQVIHFLTDLKYRYEKREFQRCTIETTEGLFICKCPYIVNTVIDMDNDCKCQRID